MNRRFLINDDAGGKLPDDAALARYRARRAPAGLAERIVREASAAGTGWRVALLPAGALAVTVLLAVVVVSSRWFAPQPDGNSPVIAQGPVPSVRVGLRMRVSVPTMTSLSMLPVTSRPPGALRSVPMPGPSMKFSLEPDVNRSTQQGDGNEDS
ncbi:MAG: hypothetical protein HKO62_09245 [Gammaproteobacteria bacterium]|nr:hypothetical protein [Gammaproteobacteria bacterium]NNM00921.1 hypothetical protein [Gammaproteobacteria bacterium]